MKKISTSSLIASKIGKRSFVQTALKNIALILVLLSTYSSYGQSVSQSSTTNITYESADAFVMFGPNCVNGGNLSFQWSINSDLSSARTVTISVGNANVGRSISLTSLLPNTRYYWRAVGRAGLNCNQTPSVGPTQTFVTSPAPPATLPTISILGTAFSDISAMVTYSLQANFGTTTSLLKYGTTSGNLFNQLAGITITTTGNAITPSSITIAGLQQNTTYFYQIEATNSAGTSTSSTLSFKTAVTIIPQLITEYSFENTYNNTSGNTPFSTNSGVSLVNDRNGNLNSAINIVNTGSIATIMGLPYGAASRTIALWVKMNNFSTTPYNMLYSYGVAGASQVNGASFSATDAWQFGYNNNHQVAVSNSVNTWYHYVLTYDGTNSKIYRNGILVSTLARTWNTVNNSDIFKLGVGVGGELTFDGAIDDLKIYNYALSLTEITNLYNNNVVTTFEETVENNSSNVYPNPAKDILHVPGQAEIFDLMGNMVASGTNEINIGHLISGIYVVKAMDKKFKIVKE